MIEGTEHLGPETREYIEGIMNSNSAHFFLKDIIREGLKRDCVDVYHNLVLAVKVFDMVCKR